MMQTKKTFVFKSLSNFHKKTILIKLVKNINLEQISGYKFVSRTDCRDLQKECWGINIESCYILAITAFLISVEYVLDGSDEREKGLLVQAL